MELSSDTQAELDLWIQRARVKFWHVWLSGVYEASGLPGATLYKPSGAKAEWQDGPDCRHPGGDGALIEESVL